jgi:Xaa-Pro dipeptidase
MNGAYGNAPRLERIQQAMQAQGVDAILSFKPENSFYLTGFNPIIYSHPVIAIVPATGAPVMLVHALRDDHARASAFVSDIRLYGAWSTKVTMGPSWLDALQRILAEAGLAAGVLGIEADFIAMTRYRELQGALPAATFENVSGLIFQMRLVKDEDEIAHGRAACAIADIGMNAAVDCLSAGGSEREIAVASMAAMNRAWTEHYPDTEVCDFGSLEGGVQNGLWTWALTGDRLFLNCDNPTPRRPVRGEAVGLFIWTNINGIHGENERTVAFGPPSADLRRALEATVEIRDRVATLLKPGTPISALYEETREGLIRHGYGQYLPGRIGHGIGLGAHEGPSLDARTSLPLAPGMMLTLEPNLRIPGVLGTQYSDTVLITPEGCEFLTNTPRTYLEV